MHTVKNYRDVPYEHAYGILCSFQGKTSSRLGVYPTFCRVAVGAKTESHKHYESEIYMILSGQGAVVVSGQVSSVAPGDLITIPSFSDHQLTNTSDEELIFLSVYSEDVGSEEVPGSVVITAAPPTPNGSLHLGHISGPYLAADTLSRYLRGRGSTVETHSGTDDHQNYVFQAASKANQKITDFRGGMRARILKGLENLKISFDRFSEPSIEKKHHKKVTDFFKLAISKKVITLENISLPYCVHCEKLLRDAHIRGKCSNCNELGSGCCESCGFVEPPNRLTDATCADCHSVPELRDTLVCLFNLSEHLHLVLPELKRRPFSQKITSLIKKVENSDSCSVIVAYPAEYSLGEEIQSDGMSMHVWFEAAVYYEEYAASTRSWVHTFGFDNSFYYLLFIPAIIRSIDPRSKLADAFIINDFLHLNGEKFSTSRGHAIWADDYSGNIDTLRLYLAFNRPQKTISNFAVADFEEFEKRIIRDLSPLYVKFSSESSAGLEDISGLVNRISRDFERYYHPQSFDLQRAAFKVLETIDLLSKGFAEYNVNRRQLLQVFATYVAPLMPDVSKNIFDIHGFPTLFGGKHD